MEGEVMWGSLALARADSGLTGEYSCTADNGVGGGLARTVRVTVNSPPRFLAGEESREVERGAGLELRCQVQEGDRPLHYRWARAGRPIQLSAR